MNGMPKRAASLIGLVFAMLLLSTCSGGGIGSGSTLYVQQLTQKAQTYNGKDVTVEGAYLWRPASGTDAAFSVLALGVSTLDSGLDAKPLGDPIWVDNFPQTASEQLHNPGDSIYGFVRLQGLFESAGNYGPDGKYKYRLQVANAQPIEQVERTEHRIQQQDLGAGKVSFFDLVKDPAKYNGQEVTTQGYYFWNSVIYVMAEGVATETDGSSPLPVGSKIWMEGFPPDKSSALNLGPNNSFVWGLVEVTAKFETGGKYGRDGAYTSQLTIIDGKAQVLEQKK
jgi:hypothetical protein